MCNKPGCCKTKDSAELPKANFSGLGTVGGIMLTIETFNQLMAIVRTGKRLFTFADPKLDELARAIAGVMAENNGLKRFVGVFAPAGVIVDNAGVDISFGPTNEYNLRIPAPSESARAKLAAQFRAAAARLEAPDPQTLLPFVDKA